LSVLWQNRTPSWHARLQLSAIKSKPLKANAE
jgi:hypothetical protein